jgi:hypothetical protein
MLSITFLFTLFSNIPKMQYLFLIISLILEEIVKVNLILIYNTALTENKIGMKNVSDVSPCTTW